jgi:hypothetical protein
VEEIKTAPPGIRRNPVAQFHCLARHYQRPFGGAHGTLSNKQVTFTSNVISTVQHWANASKTCARKIVDPLGNESTIRVPSLLIDVPTKIWRPKQLNNWRSPDYANEMDDDLLFGKEYGAAVARTAFEHDLPPRDYIEPWDDKYQA